VNWVNADSSPGRLLRQPLGSRNQGRFSGKNFDSRGFYLLMRLLSVASIGEKDSISFALAPTDDQHRCAAGESAEKRNIGKVSDYEGIQTAPLKRQLRAGETAFVVHAESL
jgi:hypothetical protein